MNSRNNRRYFKKMVLFLIIMTMFFSIPVVSAEDNQGSLERVFTTEDGLLTTSTLAITQTADGFIWIGGYGGLTRYDGNEFVSFGDSRLSSVASLLGSDNGDLWISSLDNGLIRYRDNEFYFFSKFQNNKRPYYIRDMDVGAGGTLYFAAYNGFGYIDADDQVNWIEGEGLTDMEIIDVACSDLGTIGCLTAAGEIFLYEHGVAQKVDLVVGEDNICCMDYDPYSKQFYLGTENHTMIVCNENLQFKTIMQVSGVSIMNTFGFLENGTVYVGSDSGVVSITPDGTVHKESFKVNNSIEDILVDKDNNIWFASSRQGVSLVFEGRFKDINRLAGLGDYVVNTIYYQDNRLYIGHDDGLIILNEKSYKRIYDENFFIMDGKRIRQITSDSQGNMWFSTTGDGLFKRDPNGNWTNYLTDDYSQLLSDKFRGITETSLGIIGYTDKGAYIIGNGSVELLAPDLTMRVLSLVEGPNGIYAGTDGEGIYVIRDRQIAKQITTADGLTSMRIMSMHKCSGNKGFWLSSGNTLNYVLFETEQAICPNTFPSTSVLDFVVQDDENLWVLAGNGVYQTTETTILKDNNTKDYHHYSKKNGIPYDFTANAYQAVVGDHAYLCGSSGVVWMSLEPGFTTPDTYSFVIDNINLDERSHYVQKSASLDVPVEVRRIEISAHMATYTQENPTMFYYLEGFDEYYNYVPFEKLSSIVYTNLPGGTYTFHFGVYDPAVSGPSQETSIVLNVAYPWYDNPYVKASFYGLAFLLAFLICWLGFKFYTKKEKKKLEQEYFQKEQELLKKQAYTDYLTALFNRNYLEQFADVNVDKLKFPLHFVMIDCNNLKLINDSYGHSKGDELLIGFTNIINKNFIEDDNTVIRLGGDEFLIIAQNISREEVVEKINNAIKDGEHLHVEEYPISFCFGISSCMEAKDYDFNKLSQEADSECVRSKQLYHRFNDED